jgi:hypothetical protein
VRTGDQARTVLARAEVIHAQRTAEWSAAVTARPSSRWSR